MPNPVANFTISVLASHGQADCAGALQGAFLETFPHLAWGVPAATGVNDVVVPAADLPLALPWFQQNRLGYVNGACDLDLRVAPTLPDGCYATDYLEELLR